MVNRFRSFLPVVIDVETAGFNAETDALLEVAAIILKMNNDGLLEIKSTHQYHVKPFEGANLEAESLKFNQIDPYHPFRFAIDEYTALTNMFKPVREAIQVNKCTRAILVGHNAFFDLSFLLLSGSFRSRPRGSVPLH
jgi:ribonuclease T